MITTTDTLQSLTDAFNLAGIDTPEKVGKFVTVAALQVKLNSLGVELDKVAVTQTAALEEATQAREAIQAQIKATRDTLLALVAQS